MAEKRRIVFSFDEKNFERMEHIKARGRFSSFADAVRESLTVNNALQQQADQGFTEVIVRNPKTKEEKVMIIPSA